METKTVELLKYNGREGHGTFRWMSIEDVLSLRPGQEIWFRSAWGDARRARVTGRVKTWKRTPGRFEFPIKYGLREHHRMNQHYLGWALLAEVEEK
jgi:hypothetical protein